MVLTVGWLTVPAMAHSSATNGPPANLPRFQWTDNFAQQEPPSRHCLLDSRTHA